MGLGGVINKKLTIEVESLQHGRITHILNLGTPVMDDWADSKHEAGLRKIEEAKGVNVIGNEKKNVSRQKDDNAEEISSKMSTFKEDAVEKMARVQAQQADQLEGRYVSTSFVFFIFISNKKRGEHRIVVCNFFLQLCKVPLDCLL